MISQVRRAVRADRSGVAVVRRGRCARCGSVLPLSPTGALRRHLRDGRVVRLVGRRCPGVVPALGSVTRRRRPTRLPEPVLRPSLGA